MKGNRNPGWRRTLGAFAVGAAAGSATALLLAPASGRVTRKRIAGEFRSLGRSTARQIRQTRRLLVRKAGALKETAVERLGEGREWLLERVSNGNGKHSRRLVRHSS